MGDHYKNYKNYRDLNNFQNSNVVNNINQSNDLFADAFNDELLLLNRKFYKFNFIILRIK